MANRKNLTATAQGASKSRVNRAKTVSLNKLTKKELIERISLEASKKQKADALCRELMSVLAVREDTILQKDAEIAKMEHRAGLIRGLNDSLSVCVSSLCTSLNAMNNHCETLRKSRS